MMCDDVSTLLWTALEAQGMEGDTMIMEVPNRQFGSDWYDGYIVTQSLKAAEQVSTPWQQEIFGYHSPLRLASSYYDATSAYAYDWYGNPWLECDYTSWLMPLYFHNGYQFPYGGLAWDELWTHNNTSNLASSAGVGWLPAYEIAINPKQHKKM